MAVASPWRWGQTPIGDHGDFIALFTPAGMPPMARVSITGNVAEQRPGGTAILGFTLTGVRDLEIRGNVMSGSDHQGIVTTDVVGATITDNVLTGRAGILLRDPTSGVTVSGNVAAFVEDRLKGSTGNVIGPQRKIISDRKLAESIRVIVIERVP